jgi:hypothetical protein
VRPSAYDPVLETASAGWKTQIGDFISGAEGKAGTPGGEYAANQQFYVDIQSAIEGHVARVRAASGSPEAIQILQLLSTDVENLRKLHQTGGAAGLSPSVGEPARAAIETELRALDKLESEYKGAAGTPSG